jgi:hypothetical protein
MYRLVKIIATLAVLVCVLAVFVAPSIDLPDTSLRSRQLNAAILQSLGTLMILALLAGVCQALRVRVPVRARSVRSSSQLTC